MSYIAEIVADSIGPADVRLTTFALKYPRMIHAEVLRHRAFSHSVSSTRAIPSKKMRDWVAEDPAMPVFWGKNRPGMSARDELDPASRAAVTEEWLYALNEMVGRAECMADYGAHKQITNRIIEPWGHVNHLITATDFGNWFILRCHEDAQPEIQSLAIRMLRAYLASEPKRVDVGYWHLPYITDEERSTLTPEICRRVSAARCCRVSYRTFEGKISEVEEDVALHDELLESGHWSPFEHQALCYTPDPSFRSGNFHGGWMQHRQMLTRSVHSPSRQDLEAIAAKYGDRDYIV